METDPEKLTETPRRPKTKTSNKTLSEISEAGTGVEVGVIVFGSNKTTPKPTMPCTCGNKVVGDRKHKHWVFYCQVCGSDWQIDAEPLDVPRPLPTKKKCSCVRSCSKCDGYRRDR